MKNWKLIPFFVCLTLFLSATAFAEDTEDTVSVTLLFPDGTWLQETAYCPENASLWYVSYDDSGKMAEAGRASVQGGRMMISLSEEADVVEAFVFDDNMKPLAPAALLKAPSFFQRGVNKFCEEDYAGAISDFTLAIQTDEDALSSYLWRGDAYIASGETAKNLTAAQADYEAALAIDETIPAAYLGIADVYIRRADYERAIEILLSGMNRASEKDELENKLNEIDSGTIWDLSGNIRRESGYNEDGALIWRHEHSYDAQGKLVSVTAYDADGNQTGHVDLSYDESENPLVGFNYYEDGKLRRVVYEYDEYDRCVKQSEYDPEGRLALRVLSQYDEQGYEIRTDYYQRNDDTGEIESYYSLLEYDEMGNVIKRDEYSSESVLQSYQTWKYDDSGQIKEYCYYSMESGSPELTERETYEYNGRGDCVMETRYDAYGNVALIIMRRYDAYGNYIGETYYDENGNIVYQS